MMKKIYLAAGLALLFTKITVAQTIEPQLINFTQLANFEKAHPELYTKCPTCKEEENDRGFKDLYRDLPLPANALTKKQAQDNLKNPAARPELPATPLSPSPPPNRSFLGHVDPGEGIPPDTHGAVGPNHVITATNDFLIVHNKSTGQEISRVTISSFTGVAVSCDPYIKYDPVSKRWFYSAINCEGSDGNRMAVLVSNSSDPTAGWSRYTFVPGTGYFLDHPYLGFNDKWLVISGRRFPGLTSFAGPALYIFDKANLLNNGPITFGTNAQRIEKTSSDGDAPLPVTVYGTNPNPGTFYVLQNWNGGFSAIRLTTVTGDIPNASWNTTTPVFPIGGSPWTSSTGSVAEQLGESRKLATNDARISTGVMVNGNIWCAQHIGISSTNVAVQWWQLDGSAGANFGNVLQRGRIGDGQANTYRYFPGIAVNENEDVIIGYTVSSNSSRVSSAYSFRSASTPPNTTDEEQVYKVGLSTYFKDFGGERARWGDYSHSALDPTDASLWTIQEYADQRVGNSDIDSRYGVWWAQVTPSSTLLATDVTISAVVEPNSGLLCKLPIVPTVTIRNLGTDTLRNVQLGMILDGNPAGTIQTFDNLAVGTFSNSGQLVLSPSLSPAVGAHTLKIYTLNPNGQQDLRPSNDTTTILFTVAPSLVLPYSESFERTPFPPANGSAVINPDAPGITWQRVTTAGRPGNASMRINCYNYEPDDNGNVGQRDIYRTPKIDVSVLDSLTLSFNVAHQPYFGADVSAPTNDSLNILYSTDCGISWRRTSYSKGGASLSTVNGTTSASFTPANASQWRTEKLVFRDFCTENLNNIMIGFEAVNDYGNNIFIDSLTLTAHSSYRNNALMKGISQPLPALCNGNFTPAIRFGNAGMDTLKSVDINYTVDGGAPVVYKWTGSLSKCDSVSLTLASGTASVGTHILKIYTANPNGVADEATSNDTLTKVFSVYTQAAAPLSEGFETNDIPRANWGIQNVNGGTSFERTTLAARSGLASLRINNADAQNSYGAVDYFISPIVMNNSSYDSVFVDFDMAYQQGPQYPGSTVFPLDTLEVLVTKDCGASFTSVWKKWGYELQTVNDPSYSNTELFVPADVTLWKHIKLYLTPFVGDDNYQLYFAMKGNKQNSLYLDNVNISTQTLPEKLKQQGYLIYPNPFNSSFRIHHHAVAPPTNLQAVLVYNAAGQVVWDKRYNGNADRQINVDLGKLGSGIYILKMMYSDKTVVERIVKN